MTLESRLSKDIMSISEFFERNTGMIKTFSMPLKNPDEPHIIIEEYEIPIRPLAVGLVAREKEWKRKFEEKGYGWPLEAKVDIVIKGERVATGTLGEYFENFWRFKDLVEEETKNMEFPSTWYNA